MTRPVQASEIERALWAVGLFITLVLLAIHLAACGTSQQQQAGAGVPDIGMAPWSIAGQVELSDGTVIDLGARRVITGADGLDVRRIDLDVSGGLTLSGEPQIAAFEYRAQKTEAADWLQCLVMEADVMQWRARARFPLSHSCGPPGLLELRLSTFPGAASGGGD